MTTSAPLTLTARCPEDLLAVVPVVLGFVPTDSVVMLTFGAEHSFHARVDLPDSRHDIPDLVDALVEPAFRNKVRRVVLVVYSGDEEQSRRAARALQRALRRSGVEVLEMLRADGRRWYPLARPAAPDRPVHGVPYDVSAHPFLTEAVLAGKVTHRSRDELAETLAPTPGRVDSIGRALAALPDAWDRDDPPGVAETLTEGAWVQRLLRTHTEARSSPTDEEVARLLRAIHVLRLRDAAWSTLTRPTSEAHLELWTDIVQRTPAHLVAPAATLLGWAAWQAGHGALAWCAVDLCAQVDDTYTLMTLLAAALTQALPPQPWDPQWDWAVGLEAG